MKKEILFTLIILLLGNISFAQNVTINDAKFKSYLVGDTIINANRDSEIQVSEATSYTGDIRVINKQITDFTGLEAFVNIKRLYCPYNKAPLDVTKNTKLVYIDCYSMNLDSLDLSQNPALDWINCKSNKLTELSFANNPLIRSVDCQWNSIISLDFSNSDKLTFLRSNNNKLTSLNIANGKNTKLTLYTSENPTLTCIQVDDPAASAMKWTDTTGGHVGPNYDSTAHFSTNCAMSNVSERNHESTFRVYPNPATKRVHVQSAETLQSMVLFSLNGEMIATTTDASLSIEKIAPGIYFLKVKTDSDEQHTTRLIIY